MSKFLSSQPLKGFYDWSPEEFRLRHYIFSKWREVCLSYGFEEYLTPILENADIYRAKSGEDVGLTELMVFKDQGGRELALRPEMTPSVSRFVANIYESSPKPLRLFSIANFVRNQRPQRGRNREFWQLNCDLFGGDNLGAEIEILSLSLDLVLAFAPPKDSFFLGLNHRVLLDDFFSLIEVKDSWRLKLSRLMDKFSKMRPADFIFSLEDLGLKKNQIEAISDFMISDSLLVLGDKFPELKKSEGFKDLQKIINVLDNLGYKAWCRFQASLIRGFDYYDGVVFEVFDRHPDNRRAMFGGGRYNGLGELFGKKKISAIGFAPGDETFKLFLESWGLLPLEREESKKRIYLPLLSDELREKNFLLASELRRKNYIVECGLEVEKISRALEHANKKGFPFVAIIGEEEANKGVYQIKDLASGEQSFYKL